MERRDHFLYQRLIFLLSCAFLCYEMAICREMQFQFATRWIVPFYFSSVLCLIGLGALAAHFLKNQNTNSLLKNSLLLFTVLCYPSLIFLNAVTKLSSTHLSREFFFKSSSVSNQPNFLGGFTLALLFGYGGIFILQGACYALLFNLARKENFLSRLYASDLIAAGVASVCAGIVSFFLSPAKIVIVAEILFFAALVSAKKLFHYSGRSILRVAVILAIFLFAEFTFKASSILESPLNVDSRSTVSFWTPYQKVDITEYKNDLCVYIDGWFYYNVPKPNQPFLSSDYMLLALTDKILAEKEAKVAIVGSGLGRDVFVLRRHEERDVKRAHQLSITAIELDADIPRAAKNFPWLWEKYSSAKIVGGEGRYFFEATPETFDVIHYAYLDQFARISSFSFPDASFLYTDNAVRCVLKRLNSDGYFFIKRVVPVSLEESTIQRLCATLRQAGVGPESTLLWISNNTFSVPGVMFKTLYALIKKSPFLEEEKKDFLSMGSQANLTVKKWSRKPIQAATDIYPFSIKVDMSFGAYIKSVLKNHLLVSMVGLFIMLVLGFKLMTRLCMAHFFSIGLAFMLFESVLLLNSFLLIGNPSLSMGVALGVFLSSVGCGSLLSGYIERRRKWLILLLPLVTGLYAYVVPLFIGSSMVMPKIWRIVFFSIMTLPCGIMMGSIFPVSLRAFIKEKVTILFFVNMMGCGLAPFVFNFFFPFYGYHFIISLIFLLYLFAALVIISKKT